MLSNRKNIFHRKGIIDGFLVLTIKAIIILNNIPVITHEMKNTTETIERNWFTK